MRNAWKRKQGRKYLQLQGFAISYSETPMIGDGSETALCNEGAGGDAPHFLILMGDWCGEYDRIVDQGYEACKAFYESKKGEFRSKWSEDETYIPSAEECLKIMAAVAAEI